MKDKIKSEIRIWKGRAYLHKEYKVFGLPCESDTPLGDNIKTIERFRDAYKCNIVFLNDDFTRI